MTTITSSAPASRMHTRFWVTVLCALLVIVLLGGFNATRGEPNVNLNEVWRAVIDPLPVDETPAHFLIRELRLPRVLLALLCGAALGLVGVLLQDSLRNPLADPGLLGIAQGASFAVALATIYPEIVPTMPRPLLCLIAGILSGLAVVGFSGTIRDPVRVILSGAVLSGFFGVMTTAVILLAPYERTGGFGAYYRYVSGSISAAEWDYVFMVLPWLALGIPAALLAGRALNLLQLGDELATGAGLNPFRTRILLILIAMLLVSPVIAAIGPIAFIALFAPHIARGLLAGSDARRTLVLSALCGAALLQAADTAGRLLFFPMEIPAGIWTVAMVGPAAVIVVGRIARARRA
ncbi:iron chelate uptake ABC transporter family permease subunit [bacterium]|nr:iron chelate uptake ABC transporter family permease subunit [bacterium]